MSGIGTILGVWTLGQTFNKIKDKGTNIAKNSFNIRSTCRELGIPLPVEDNYKVLYIESLLKLCDAKHEYLVWCSLFELETVFNAFKEANQNGKREIFYRELEHQLHVNNKLVELKGFNNVPSILIDNFFDFFTEFRNSVKTPIQSEFSESLTRIEEAVNRESPKQDNNVQDQKNSTNLIEQFKSASFILAEAPNTFNDIEDSHIDREETKTLLEWIEKPIEKKEKPIALLVGNAGAGKTTILRDLYEELNKDKTPILGIKADRYCVESLKDLANRLNIDEQILNSFKAILNEKERLVLLIDQIDALSQSLSARREYLDTINQLVRNASDLSGIRIIISIRTFDLAYDDDFKYYKKQKEIVVKGLTKAQIEKVLTKIEFPIPLLTDTLLELFKTPLHLNVFCKVYEKNKSFQDIKTLNDLYGKLWQEKIVNIKKGAKTNKKKCKKLLFKLAMDMNKGQWITLNSSKYNEDFSDELIYLQSVGLVNTSKNEIQFFHQTFYDFCFAKRFVEKGESLTEFILKKNQTLFVRSAVKMILNFQRTDNLDSYIENYQEIITSGKYRFHIKLLLINLLGFIDDPTEKEKIFVSEIVLKSSETYYIFLESAFSAEWFKFLQEETTVFTDLFNTNGDYKSFETTLTDQKIEITDFWYQFFRKYIYEHSVSILKVLKGQPESKDKDTLIVSCLFILGKWDIPEAFTLFERYRSKNLINQYLFCNIIADVCRYDFDWAIEKYSEVIKQKIVDANDKDILSDTDDINWQLNSYYKFPNLTRDDENLIKKMREINAQEFFKFGVELCIKYITTHKKEYYTGLYPAYGCISDYYFSDFYFDEIDDSHSDQEILFSEVAKTIKILAKEGDTTFTNFVEKHIDSKYISILKLLVYGFIENPALYSSDIVSLIRNLDNKNGFVVDHHFYLYIRELIKSSFEYLSNEQKQFVVGFICSFELNYKIQIKGKSDPKYKRRCFYNFEKEKYRFIKVIGSDELNQFPILLKTLQELDRKYPIIPKENRGGLTFYSVNAPINFESCNKFTLQDWRDSFKKYSCNDYPSRGIGQGGLNEHARQFYHIVSKNPQNFTQFINDLIDENIVAHEYLFQGMNGLENGNCDLKIFENLLFKIRKLELSDSHQQLPVNYVEYFIQNKYITNEIFNFIVSTALDKTKSITHKGGEDIMHNSLASLRGAALSLLCQFTYCPRHKEEIFTSLNKIANEKNEVLLVTLVSSLPSLINLDKNETLNTFLLATENLTSDVAINAMPCLKYFANDNFPSVVNVITEAIQFDKVLPKLAWITGWAWMKNLSNTELLLESILKQGVLAKAMMIELAEENLMNTTKIISKRAQEIFIRYLSSNEEEIVSNYSSIFHQLEKDNFIELLPLIEKYSTSNVATKSPLSFIDYISKCSKKHPCECIDLVSNFHKYEIERGSFHRVSPISVVVGAINSLNQITSKSEKDNRYIEKGISLFDSMLKDSRLRNFAESALNEID